MNSLILGAIGLLALYLGYRFYGSFVERRLIGPNDKFATPAIADNDGVDYYPAKASMLFGHHFASIAGAGPIIGPLIGVAYFGWLGSFIWVVLGSIFIGAVHDYTSLMISVRNKGKSIADVARITLGTRAKNTFSVFLWLALVLVVASFGDATAQTLVAKPQIVIPTFGLIFLAMGFGHVVYRLRLNVIFGTFLALLILAGLVYLGELFPIAIPGDLLGISSVTFWFWVLMLYCLFASVLPVWILLQPRDYLSSWLLYGGMLLGFLGLAASHPRIQSPGVVTVNSPQMGPMWPMMFVLIACGAVSGFHSLVASGTTAKQLAKEGLGRRIAFGSMLVEAALAIMVIMIAAAALVWDPSAAKSEFGLQYLMNTVGQGGGGGPVVTFATGFGKVVQSIPGIPFVVGTYFGMLMLNAFIITTLDTSTRLARFITTEIGGARAKALSNRWIATLVTIIASGLLGATGGIKTIWPVFGAANQLMAALALVVVSSYLMGVKRPKLYTVLPAIFMLVTTIGALIFQTFAFFKQATAQGYVLGFLSLVLVALATYIAIEARDILLFMKRKGTVIADAHPAWGIVQE